MTFFKQRIWLSGGHKTNINILYSFSLNYTILGPILSWLRKYLPKIVLEWSVSRINYHTINCRLALWMLCTEWETRRLKNLCNRFMLTASISKQVLCHCNIIAFWQWLIKKLLTNFACLYVNVCLLIMTASSLTTSTRPQRGKILAWNSFIRLYVLLTDNLTCTRVFTFCLPWLGSRKGQRVRCERNGGGKGERSALLKPRREWDLGTEMGISLHPSDVLKWHFNCFLKIIGYVCPFELIK